MKKKRSFAVRRRAFAVWQKLGYFPWKKEKEKAPKPRKGKVPGDFYKGAFDSIPFLNDDAKRTFGHLLLRPGYMIRDYLSGQHERYLAPLTALIIFYAFFGLVSAVLQPIQKEERPIAVSSHFDDVGDASQLERGERLAYNAAKVVQRGYVLLHLDQYPGEVDTQQEASLAALENALRSQGIPLFLGNFIILWLAMTAVLRRYGLKSSACAACAAYVLCQFSFFMLFAVLLSWGRQTSVSALLLLALLTVDYRQMLGIKWGHSLGRAAQTGLLYGLYYVGLFLAISALTVLVAVIKG